MLYIFSSLIINNMFLFPIIFLKNEKQRRVKTQNKKKNKFKVIEYPIILFEDFYLIFVIIPYVHIGFLWSIKNLKKNIIPI